MYDRVKPSFWRTIIGVVSHIEELELYMGRWDLCDQTGKDPVLEAFLKYGHFPNLSKLHLWGEHEKPATVDTRLLKPFLWRHRQMRSVVLKDLLVNDALGPAQLCDGIKCVLVHARETLRTDARFEMHIFPR
ncbi:hypothetical protein CLAFUW4_11368 [Fulvia fulva]|uniref:Uncharacterized protein n=1 Tax=Passalora fulva TaxID=5499 RepID=A0A9Q8PDH5_PASFU|nr:uncharacterized protein CLAFUR5_10409 [Fulvia fulva]KAK4620124.1 hypothetical protein CLAFUR4_11374 [Fulvia fulva]KAK4620456.1 hypothetical protein CLAFUR0_11380 [Fulvia fulva]UJO20435.1 hypothetical protein CLAFUR5_10409 [Fulvia fulva]WPV17358.1 hypothetical protein CLAFUW4_11368 [Fulvia fulva]WPV32356.1 hypothetical protein CLAFUW7_11364 [Fulvia fulva]